MRKTLLFEVLLGGWLLMKPPFDTKGDRFVTIAEPDKRRWTQLSAYDSAAECEKAKNTLIDDAKTILEGVTIVETVKQTPAFQALLDLSAVCVPSEHVYPPRTK